MLGDIIVLTFLCLLLVGSFFAALGILARCKYLTILDVQKVIRPVQQQRIIHLLDSQVEEVVRSLFTRPKFRDSQLTRLYEIREYLLRMSHNAMVFIVWANTEVWREMKFKTDMDDREVYIELGRKVHAAAIEFRIYALLTIIRINFWMIFRLRLWSPFPAPRITDLRQMGGLRFYASYQRLREAVLALCLAYGEEFHEEMMSVI